MKFNKRSAAFKSSAVAALVALSISGVHAQDELLFPVGEGAFNWDSYNSFADANSLDGETLTVFGPILG